MHGLKLIVHWAADGIKGLAKGKLVGGDKGSKTRKWQETLQKRKVILTKEESFLVSC